MGDDGLTLSICLRCRDGREDRNTDLGQRGGRRLAHAVADAFPDSTAARRGIRLRGVNCMSNCKRPCTIALSGPGRFTYLFGDLDPTLHAGDVLSVAAAYAEAESGGFDLFLWAQHTAPAGDPGLFLSLFFETDAARNYSGWTNAAYDALIAELRAEGDPQARIDLALRAQEMIAAEAPVSFLVTPEWHVGLSPALAGYEPWGSDYYVIRPDLVTAR